MFLFLMIDIFDHSYLDFDLEVDWKILSKSIFELNHSMNPVTKNGA